MPLVVPKAPGSWGAAQAAASSGAAGRSAPYGESRSPSRPPRRPEAEQMTRPQPPPVAGAGEHILEAVQARAHAAAVEMQAEEVVAEVRRDAQSNLAAAAMVHERAEHAIHQVRYDAAVHAVNARAVAEWQARLE